MNAKDPILSVEHLREVLVYSIHTGEFRWVSRRGSRAAGAVAGSSDRLGYVVVRLNNKAIGAHRLAWLYYYGRWPERHIDHIDGNKANNRIVNLREASRSQNLSNMPGQSTEGLPKGVRKVPKREKWFAQMHYQGERMHLGTFDSPEEASRAYLAKAEEVCGAFAYHKSQEEASMVKKAGISIPGYKLDREGRIVKDHAAADAKLDVSTRLKKRNSSRVSVKRIPRPAAG